MKIQRPQATVGWIPSRRRYALFRLAAYLRLLRTPPERRILDETKVLAIDRDQSTAETYSVAALVWLTFSCFIAELLSWWLPIGVAFSVALPIVTVALTLVGPFMAVFVMPLLHTVGLPRGPHNIGVASATLLLAMSLMASYFALSNAWVRVPSRIFLGVLAMNGVAALILFALRKRVREAEMRCVA
jgi:hypothetical protein